MRYTCLWFGRSDESPRIFRTRVLSLTSRGLAAILWSYIRTANRAAIAMNLGLPLREYLAMLAPLRFRDLESVVYDQLAPQIARYPSRSDVLEWVRGANGVVERLHHRTGNSWQCHFRFALQEVRHDR